MTTDTTGTEAERLGHPAGAPAAPNSLINAPVRPDQGAPLPGAPWSTGAPPVHVRTAAPASSARISAPDAPGNRAPVHGTETTGAPKAMHRGNRGAPIGARAVHRLSALLVHRGNRPSAPVHHPAAPVDDPGADPVRPAPAPIAVRTAPPKRAAARAAADTTASLADQWGKLKQDRSPALVGGLRLLAALIVISLVGVVIAPPSLSAHDIIGWAQSKSTDSGLGLNHGWAWITFLALDFAAGVCVLICVYCAIVNTKPGVFALYVWAFAGATAYANYSFGSRPGAPGDAKWFFPAMSLVGPLLLHSVLIFLRKRVKGAQGNKRGQRPAFPLVDWMPITGTPQDTYGAWRTGAMLGIETPDAALWAYRAVSLESNWFSRWFVKRLVRTEQTLVFRARLADENLALAIPGLVPAGAFVDLTTRTAPTGATAPGAPVHQIEQGAMSAGARPAAPVRTVHGAPSDYSSAPAGAPLVQTAGVAAPDAPDAPGALVHDDLHQIEQGTVVNLDDAARASARTALVRIFEAYGDGFGGWAALTAGTSLSRIERELSIGKRRSAKALAHAETVLPWADAPAGVEQYRTKTA